MESPLTIAGQSVEEKLASRMGEITNAVNEAIQREVQHYAELPPDVLSIDLPAIITENLRLSRRALRERRPPQVEELSAISESAQLRAEEGVSLEMVISAYVVGAHEVWRTATEGATPDDLDALREFTDLTLAYLRPTLTAVSSTFAAEVRDAHQLESGMQPALALALISGALGEAETSRVGAVPAESYAVLKLTTLPITQTEERAETAINVVASASRRRRRIRSEVANFPDFAPLVVSDATGEVVLFPLASRDESSITRLTERLREMVHRLNGQAPSQPTFHAALAVGTREEVPDSLRLADEMIHVAFATERPPGLLLLEEMLLDYQLHRPTPATDALAALLSPLEDQPVLLDTLETHISLGLHRARTAEAMVVHPNTVDYRLRRVAELTSLSPNDASDLATLRAAVAARRGRSRGT